MKTFYIFAPIFIINLLSCSFSEKKQGYIIMNTVFSDYKGTLEFKKKATQKESRYKSMLDSIKLEIDLIPISIKNKSEKRDSLIKLYNQTYSKIADFNKSFVESEELKIWSQINQYVSEFGKERDYDLIFGANGNGSIMYADSSLNITPEVLKYINEKYSGK
ncbi:MAG: OmpH family outer membrane protein [Cytophagaceae bacterium]|jgi:outer membrane protein|nr:OmpH family outer membrane protein [Cytophagaceae bacterium]